MKIRPISVPQIAPLTVPQGKVVHLAKFYLAIRLFNGDNRVFQADQVFFLHFQKIQAHLFGLNLRGIDNYNKICHKILLRNVEAVLGTTKCKR